jgi:outer membrane receptor for ferrienterochelin and colicins
MAKRNFLKLIYSDFLIGIITIISVCIFLQQPIISEEAIKRKIVIGTFQPYNSDLNPDIQETINKQLSLAFRENNYEVFQNDNSIETNLDKYKSDDSVIYITGNYNKSSNSTLNLYCQIYDPNTGYIIDAINITNEILDLEGITLPDSETKEDDDNSIISKLVPKVVLRIKLNVSKKEKRENINEYIISSPISKDINFKIRKENVAKETEAIFKLFENYEVVTATRTKSKIKETPAAVYVVTSQMIQERGYRTLVEALKDIPGIDFQHTYGVFPELIHQRGLIGGNQRTLLYVDGSPDNNINENAMLAGSVRFPLNNVERIEVVSGPASALYGANAFNGIINIITKDGSSNPGNHVDLTYGAYGSNPGKSMSFSARGVSSGENPISYSVGGYYYKTAGPNFSNIRNLNPPNNGATDSNKDYNYNFDPNYYLATKACGDTTCTPNSKSIGYFWSPTYNNSQEDTYNITAKFSKGGLRFQTTNWQYNQGQGTFANGTQQIDTKSSGFRTGDYSARNLIRAYGVASGILTNSYVDKEGNIISSNGIQGFTGSGWNFRSNSALTGYIYKFNEKLSLDSEVIVRNTEVLESSHEQYPNTSGPGAYYRPGDVTKSNSYARQDTAYWGEQRLTWNPTSNITGIYGISARHFTVAKDYGSNEIFTYTNYAIFIQQSIRPVSKIQLSAGYRRDYITTYGYTSNPRLSLVYSATNNLTFKLLSGSAFREPSVQELFSQTPQRKPNPNLSPEKLQSLELGANYRFLRNYFISAQTYYNKVTNMILQVQTTDRSTINGISSTEPWLQNQNIGKANVYGFELDSSATILKNLNLTANYTYAKGEYYDLPASLDTSPSTAGRLGANYSNDIIAALYENIYGSSTSPRKGSIPNIAPHKINAGITYYLIKNLSFYLGVNYVDVRRTIATNPEATVPGYKMVKINIRWEDFYKPGMYMQLTINNLTNEQFFDPGIRSATGGYYPTQHPLETRNIWFTLGYKF